MTFLEARQIVSTFQRGDPLPFLLAMSGTADPLDLFVRAAAAKRGRAAEMRALPFNTLGQALRAAPRPEEREVFLLLPWDFVPEADWRSGVVPSVDEAQLRKATLFVLYVKEVAVYFTAAGTPLGRSKWQDDPEANAIMCSMFKLGSERGINIVPLYAVSQDAAATIVDLAATMGIDFLVIGASQRTAMTKLLRGSVATNVAQHLPDSINLLIFG